MVCLASIALVSAQLPGPRSKGYTAAASAIRKATVYNPSYDRHIPPTSDRTFNFTGRGKNGSDLDVSEAGTDVTVELRVFKIQEANPAEGTMRLKVWLRQMWVDQRLAWDPAEYEGVSKIPVRMRMDEQVTEIWRPDILLYNSLEGVQVSLGDVYADVNSDGSIFFSQPGMFEVIQYEGAS
jgi:hypothetical protein